jgi:hypothetical protein
MIKAKKWGLAKRVVAFIAVVACITGSIACSSNSGSGRTPVQVAQTTQMSDTAA